MRTVLLLLLAAGCAAKRSGDRPWPPANDLAANDSSAPDAATASDAATGEPDLGDATPFGANVTAGGVSFRVWAPHAAAAAVAGDFPEHSAAMTSEPGGVFATTLASAHAGTQYHFVFTSPSGTWTRLDPYCRQALADGSGCVVVDPSAYAWKSPSFARPPREDTVVYELHVGSFAVAPGAAAGTFADARAGLPALAELGVNVVELMPIQMHGSSADAWGYNPQLYLAPKSEQGGADDLRAFVDEAHARGLGVWLDTVVNHYDGWAGAPLACYDGDCNGARGVYFFPPGPYATTPWGPRPNYAEPQVAALLRASVRWWLVENRGDGFRWDSVSNIRALDGNGSVPGGKALLTSANDLTHALGGASVAEDLKGWDAITRPVAQGGFGFDAQWDGFGWAVTNLLTQASDDARDLGVVANALGGSYGGDGFARLLWTENHDTVGNGGARLPSRIDAADATSFYARRRSMLGAVLLLSSPGVPMLFMGQESLAGGTFTNQPPPLADSLPPIGAKIRSFYKDMIALRRNRDGNAGGLRGRGVEILHRDDATKVIAYRRFGAAGEDVIVVLNLRNRAYQRYDIGVGGAGDWRIRLDTDWKTYSDDFGGGATGSVTALPQPKDNQPYTLPLQLGAYGAVVLTR